MAIPRQAVDIALRGLNTKADPKRSVPGELVDVQNARFEKGDPQRGVRISKRWGSRVIDTANQPSRIFGLGGKAYSLRSSGGEQLFEIRGNGALGSQTLGRMGAPMAWASTVRSSVSIPGTTEPSWVVDSAQYSGSTVVYLLNENDGQRVIWYDSAAEKVLASYKSTAATGQRARIMVVAGKVLVALFNEGATNIRIYEYTTSSATLRATISNVFATWPNVAWDWAADGDSSAIYLSHVETTSSATLIMRKITIATWAVTSSATWAAASAVTAVGVGVASSGASTEARVFWADNATGLSTRTYSNALANTLATTLVEATGGASEARRAIGTAGASLAGGYVVWNVAENVAGSSTRWHSRIHCTYVSAAGVPGTIKQTRGAGLCSKPYLFVDGATDRVVVLGALGSTTDSGTAPPTDEQTGYVFLEVTQEFALRARLLHLTAGRAPPSTSAANGAFNRFGLLVNMHQVGDVTGQGATQVFGCAGVSFDSTLTSAESSLNVPIPRLLACSMTPTIGYFATEQDSCLLVSGGVLHSFDGVTMRESGFYAYPTITRAVGAAAGGSIADGTYSVVVMYERIDARGRVVESAVSPPSTVTVAGGGGNGSISLTATTYRLGLTDGEQERIIVFRGISGSATWRRTDINPNFRTIDESSFTLTENDANVSDEAVVYKVGGEEDHTQPSAPVALWAEEDRLWCVSGDARNRVQFSKPLGSGIAPAFYPEAFRAVASSEGAVTGLAMLGGVTVATTARSWFALSGSCPDRLGNGDSLGEFQRRSAKFGALTQRHIISDGDALYLFGHTGLNRIAGAGDYVGAPVEDFIVLAAVGSPTYAVTLNNLRDACFVSDRKELHFALANGVELVYNTEFQLWSTNPRTFAAAMASIGGLRYLVSDATYTADVYGVGATVQSGIYAEAPGKWTLDAHVGSTPERYELSITTGWIRLDGIAGYMLADALRVLASYQAGGWRLGVSFGLDDDNTWLTEQTLDPSSLAGSGGAFLGSAEFPIQECMSFRARIRETSIGSVESESGHIAALSLLLGIQPGGRRVPAANTF